MPFFAYQWPDDNVAKNATITSSASPSDYPASALADGSPGFPGKLTTTGPGWFLFSFAGLQRVDLVSIIHSNLQQGLTGVDIQAGSDPTFSTSSLNHTFTIGAWRQDGYPKNHWMDLRGKAGYTTAGYQYWRIAIGTANNVVVSIGEVWLGRLWRQFPFSIQWKSRRSIEYMNAVDETDTGSHVGYSLGGNRRGLIGTIDYKNFSAGEQTSYAEIEGWQQNTQGNLKPFLIIPSDDSDAWLVKNREPLVEHERSSMNKFLQEIDVVEVGRGVAP